MGLSTLEYWLCLSRQSLSFQTTRSGFKETKQNHPRFGTVERIRDKHGLIFKSCVCRAVSSDSSHHPQYAIMVYFSLYIYLFGRSIHTGRHILSQ